MVHRFGTNRDLQGFDLDSDIWYDIIYSKIIKPVLFFTVTWLQTMVRVVICYFWLQMSGKTKHCALHIDTDDYSVYKLDNF